MNRSWCPGSSPLNLQDECIFSLYSAVIPAALTFLLVLYSLPIPAPKSLGRLVTPFLTLEDALKLTSSSASSTNAAPPTRPGKNIALSVLSLLESLTWTAIASFRVYTNVAEDSEDHFEPYAIYTPLLIALTWLWASLRCITRRKPTPPRDVFILFLVHFGMAVLTFARMVYIRRHTVAWPHQNLVIAALVNLAATLALLCIILSMPLGIPDENIDPAQIGKTIAPEDYTTLWGWISFDWVDDVITRGTKSDLNEEDVPKLSPTMQSRAVFERFAEFKRSTLLRQIFAANSLDMILDVSLTLISAVCNYASPFFLKQILHAFEVDTPEARSKAYIYALLSFLAACAKAESDVQHLWYGRRACTRVRSELMAAIYEKALKRKDFTGITQAKEKEATTSSAPAGHSRATSVDSKTSKKTDAKTSDKGSKAGADTGKIVQLMSADANRIAMMITTGYFIYGAPIEICIASIMLYQILGWSAFIGFGVLVVISPLNHVLSKRGVTISRGLSTARDKRMGVLNELIGAISFIKFFAWESQWIKRVLDSRSSELKWLIKERANSIIFGLLWTLAPVFVSIISFFAFVHQGNQLTISTAFTAIALFNMLKMPLNVIPMFIVQLLQAGVALDRISTFLKEDEVPDLVSSFKRPVLTGSASLDDETIGISHSSFKWNEAIDPPDAKDQKKSSNAPIIPVVVITEEPETYENENPSQPFELRDIDVLFPVGELTLVTGNTASGKTALLMALLGEMTMLPGNAESKLHLPKNLTQLDAVTGLRNAVSYCSQRPWLEHSSIRENILFGSPFEQERYDAVIECCALKPDLDRFDDGDETEIGSRGVSLSGGQKARVALARAVYARTKHVLLDDPLAAVDSHTARILFDKLLMGPLMSGRTVILVTHHIELVRPGAYYIVRMLDGRIDTQGTIKELEARGLLDAIVHDTALDITPPESREESQVIDKESAEVMASKALGEPPAPPTDDSEAQPSGTKKKPRKLVKDEARSKGNVKWNIYKTYLEASSWFTWICLFVLVVSYQGFGVLEKLWLREWGLHYSDEYHTITSSSMHVHLGADVLSPSSHDLTTSNHYSGIFGSVLWSSPGKRFAGLPELPSANDHPLFYVGVYAALGIGAGLLSSVNSAVQYVGAYRASKKLFTRLLTVVIGSPMRFFDTTPTGRILNRFSRDVEVVDSSLSSSLRSTTSWIATFIASVLTVCIVLPEFLPPAILIAYGYYRLSYGYVVAGRSLRRMESTTRSPIFAAFGDMLEGLVTVRAFASERRFLDNLHEKVDLTTTMWYNFWMCNRWLLLRFDVLGGFSTLVTTVFALVQLDAGLAALTITSAMAFTSSVYWTCRMITQLEMDLNSVERVVEYLDLPQEPPAIIESNRVPAYWPSSSNNDALVVVEDLVVKYAPELPSVLHGVSFTLKARERVGLLGRTGSGKSTLAMSLLRFIDPHSGRIIIDGIDISKIGLYDLRSRLTIIPQDAVLFSGTIRDNLDPFGEHSDTECQDALTRVHLYSESNKPSRLSSRAPSIHESGGPSEAGSEAITAFAEQKSTVHLDTQVSAGGANFSQGQKQLIAMARALLRQSSIIIMDEATSSIDFATDSLVQKTIREEFSNSLLITIAHRIRTIIDYDRLLVVDVGKVIEFDTPMNLIRKEGGLFREMCLKSGSFDELLSMAGAGASQAGF